MVGLSGFASHQCSVHLGAGNSGSSSMSQAPNLHLAMQLLKAKKKIMESEPKTVQHEN